MLIGIVKVNGTDFTFHMAGDHGGDFLQKLFHAGGIMKKAGDLPHVTDKLGMVALDEHLNDQSWLIYRGAGI